MACALGRPAELRTVNRTKTCFYSLHFLVDLVFFFLLTDFGSKTSSFCLSEYLFTPTEFCLRL